MSAPDLLSNNDDNGGGLRGLRHCTGGFRLVPRVCQSYGWVPRAAVLPLSYEPRVGK